MALIKELVYFSFSGIVGFGVDVLTLYLLCDFLGVYIARVISFITAVFVTWLINRNLTFGDRESALNAKSEFIAYFVLMLGGGAVNYAVFFWLIFTYEQMSMHPVFGVAIGSLCGMMVNLMSSKFFLYTRTR